MPLGLASRKVMLWSFIMRAAILFTTLFIPAMAHAQSAAPAKPPTVGGRPLVQVKPTAPVGCKFVGWVKGTKLWAGDCMASELKPGVPAQESSTPPLSDQGIGAIPKGQE